MLARHCSRRRRGATTVEFAVIAPVVLFFLIALFVGGPLIFRYQEVAHLARDGARYASTHGGLYQREGVAALQPDSPAIASSADLSSYLAGRTMLLDPNQLEVSVSWSASGLFSPPNMPSYENTDPSVIPPGQLYVFSNNPMTGTSTPTNYVTVNVTYQWFPPVRLIGPITLSSTSKMPMSY